MAEKILTNIAQLLGLHPENNALRGFKLAQLPSLQNAYLHLEDDRIKGYGTMKEFSYNKYPAAEVINLDQATVLPCWCDSHTHLVFGASRESEFLDRIRGLSYAEINARGGGILNSTKKIKDIPESELYEAAAERLKELILLGTGAIEIKSGYGLTLETELKILRVIRSLKLNFPIPVKATFLGAHAYPENFKNDHAGYLDLIIQQILPEIAAEQLADYMDVFCENGFFNVKETISICQAGLKYGLKPKLHVNQLSDMGGVQAGIGLNALSLDHLEILTDDSIAELAHSATVCTLLPTAAYFLGVSFPPARKLIDSGCIVALASDFNPGTSPSGNMQSVVSMSCIQMKMLPEEAINAATLNGACALELQQEVGSISAGKKANLIITKKIPSLAYLPYSFGTNLIERVMIGGNFIS